MRTFNGGRMHKGDFQKGTGVFIYGDGPNDTIPVTWRITAGRVLSNEESWQAEVTGRPTKSQQKSDTNIFTALERNFIFKLETEDGSVFPCGICNLDYFADGYPSTWYFEICSRDQKSVKYEMGRE
jgi:hypothetical protein